MQDHYLPKGAYLRFFENPKKPGFVYLYQRNKDMVKAMQVIERAWQSEQRTIQNMR